MKTLAFAAALGLAATAAFAAPEKYTLDSSHSQIVFSYNHLGYSTTYGMFSGFEGVVMLDEADPAASSVEVSMPARSMITGWDARLQHFMGKDFFAADENEQITFRSTSIELTGKDTANISGDLTINGVTKQVTLAARLNKMGNHPMRNKGWAGFDATTTLKRSDYNLGAYAPAVSDEIEVMISIEVEKAQ